MPSGGATSLEVEGAKAMGPNRAMIAAVASSVVLRHEHDWVDVVERGWCIGHAWPSSSPCKHVQAGLAEVPGVWAQTATGAAARIAAWQSSHPLTIHAR